MRTKSEKIAMLNKSWYKYLRANVARNGDRVFVFDDSRSYTWKEATLTIEALAYRLSAAGVRKGTIVAVRAVRSIDTLFLWQALSLIGAVCVLTDAHFPAKSYIEQTGVGIEPELYVTNEDASGGISASGDWKLKDGAYRDVAALTFDVPAGHASDEAERMDAECDVTALTLIIFTSGSTGKSKAVMLCQRNVISNSVDGGDLFEECEKDVSACVLPPHHIFCIALMSVSVVMDHALYFPDDPSPASLITGIEKYGVTVLYAVPTYFLALAENEELSGSDLSSMRFGLIAGGPSTPAQMEFIERSLGCRLVPVYGMSEFVGVTTLPYDSPSELRCSGVGTFYPLNEGFILDDDGNEVKQGEEGEICVRGFELMLGYYGDEEETKAAVDEQGRLHTGDLGYFDERGIMHISGRKKDIIIRGGENISAGKIERALLSLPGVYQAAAVGLRDDYLGEVPCAAVIPEKGASIEEEALRVALAGRLSKHEIPVKIAVLSAFPLTSTGKPDKQRLKEMFD